ncbi:tetratricopeptide repeat protein [Bacillus suaedaesalsae]|uniref:Tetratricopeptide repeat protein n=1 Tax=Bacillus suaedaesalsae TaxID=2810349 RepID=A0ABS2DPW2_9BACI|nr:tetratricopeptide repeat protein [Bacillus suaedaesalsae]MBM6619783.1 tetratricopeptide repeat protein [Bacillus suaedaesalsae]
MDNNDQFKNVIPFPNLQKRLLDKGMEALQKKNFDEALALLQQALEYDDSLDEVQFGIVICLFELGYLEEAKVNCSRMLKEDVGDYYDVLQLYLTILVQLGNYEEVESTIEAVLQEDKIPPQTVENFYKLLDFSRKMTADEDVILETQRVEVTRIIESDSVQEQWNVVQALRNERLGIAYSFPILDQYLLDEMKHPIVKTSILQLLIEKDIFREVSVEKFGKVLKVNTAELYDMETHAFTHQVIQVLDDTLGNENPSLFEVAKEMWFRHLYVNYPFNSQPENEAIWAAGLHKVGYDLHGIDIEAEEIAELYKITIQDLLFASCRIKEIEEISFIPM